MKLNWPLRFQISAPRRLEPLRSSVASTHQLRLMAPGHSDRPQPLTTLEFRRLLAQYRRIGFEKGQLWTQSRPSFLHHH